jgi:hypothetical protein
MFLACTTIRHFLRAPRRIVGQIGNLRRIVNPPAALGRARRDRGESPTPFAACRYAGQDEILRGGWLPPPFSLHTRSIGPIANRPQLDKLPRRAA